MVAALGGFKILANPFIIIAIAVIASTIYFRKPITESLGGLGWGLGQFGKGLNTFVSQIASPKIEPTLGLHLTGAFGMFQDLFQKELDKRNNGNQNQDGNTAGNTGGYNYIQGITESGGSAWDMLWKKQWV